MQCDCGNFRGVRAGGAGNAMTGPEQVRVLVGQNLTLGTQSEGPLISYSGGFDLVALAVGCAPLAAIRALTIGRL